MTESVTETCDKCSSTDVVWYWCKHLPCTIHAPDGDEEGHKMTGSIPLCPKHAAELRDEYGIVCTSKEAAIARGTVPF